MASSSSHAPGGGAGSGAAGGGGGAAVDEDLYSRQLYALGGHSAQRALSAASVLIVNLRGVGVEIAKNLILMGIKHCELFDPAPASWLDLAGQFYLTPEDVGHPRALRSLPRLQALNQYVSVAVAPEAALTPAALARFSVIVATDCSESQLAELGGWARAAGKQFIAAEARGGFGRVFTDLGAAHTVLDADGQPAKSGVLALVTADEVGSVSVVQDARHGLSVGDHVVFSEVAGCAGLNDGVPRRVVSVPDAGTFTLGDLRGLGGAYAGGGLFTSVKVPAALAFQPAPAMLRPVGTPGGPASEEAFSVTDFAKFDRPAVLHSAFCALHEAGVPAPGDEAGAQRVLGAAEALCSGAVPPQALTPALRAVVLQLARGAAGSLSPLCAAIGGVAAQEVIKGVTGNFTPLRQWLYLDVSEALPPGAVPPPLALGEVAPRGDRYDGQAAVLGRAVQARLGALRYFLVGAGAIGCEVLKTWALMGVGCGAGGCVTVTDMDTIERSNLARQFLFRAADIGKLKATAAVRAACAMNSELRAVAYEARVGEDSEGVFDARFWGALAGVCTALDNVDARLYIDRCCLRYRVPMLDSGTEGTLGSTQVVFPGLTENYGARQDPPAVGIPVCTLKDFPFKIEHTLAWARDWFEGEFKQVPEAVNAYLSQPGFLEALKAQTNTQIETLKKILSALVHERPTTMQDCVKWACLRFAELYRNRILQLQHKFPEDTRTSQGEAFWSGTKRFPRPCVLDAADPLHADYIAATARLRGALYGLTWDASVHTPAWVAAAAAASPAPDFEPSDGVAIPTTEAEAEELKKAAEEAAKAGGAWDVQVMADALARQLPTPASLAGFRCTPLDFEKDDDLHITWVTAASNLRARNYRVAEATKHASKLIAGKIIPAIATTTALVSGLICSEVYKLVGSEALTMERLRSCSLNLALAFVGLSEPLPPKRSLLTLPAGCTLEVEPSALAAPAGGGGGGGGAASGAASGARVWAWSAWDSITLQGPLTLQGFLDFVQAKLGRAPTWVNVGSVTIYSNMHKKSMIKERLPRVLSDVYCTVLKRAEVSHSRTLTLHITVADEPDGSGEHKPVEFPEIRYVLGPEELRGEGGAASSSAAAAAAAAPAAAAPAAPSAQPAPSFISPALAAQP